MWWGRRENAYQALKNDLRITIQYLIILGIQPNVANENIKKLTKVM